jgi:hypothetical protein
VKRMDVPPAGNGDWARPADRSLHPRQSCTTKAFEPSREASRATLIRRLSFDLTGLPPTPDELSAFLDDTALDAYEAARRAAPRPRRALVNASASLWLRLRAMRRTRRTRSATTPSSSIPTPTSTAPGSSMPSIRDLPYDQFVKFQIAADKVPSATRDDQAGARASSGSGRSTTIATSWRCRPTNGKTASIPSLGRCSG